MKRWWKKRKKTKVEVKKIWQESGKGEKRIIWEKPKVSSTRKFADWWETTPVEKFLEDVDYLLKKSAFLSVISLLAQITIIISLITWITGIEERRENEIFATWQVVNQASGKGDKTGGVKIGLERLLKNDFSLAGLNLSNTQLYGANLEGAELWGTNLQGAGLVSANLEGVYLGGGNLKGANLREANLQKANLSGAENLTNQQIKQACFWEKTSQRNIETYLKQTTNG